MPYPNPEFSRSAPTPAGPPNDPTVAFEAMVREHYGRLCAFAFRLLGSREGAEDVVHDVLLRVWRDRERFEFRDPLAYLYRAVRNQVVSEYRRAGVRSRAVSEHAQDIDPATVTVTPGADSTVERDDLARAAARAIASLPERCRLVYTMRREQGLSYAEIARVLDVTTKTVENQMNRAAKLLRARLDHYLSAAVALASSAGAALWR